MCAFRVAFLESLYLTGHICMLSFVLIQCAISVVALNCVENYNNHKHLKISGKFIQGFGQYCMSSTTSLPKVYDPKGKITIENDPPPFVLFPKNIKI